MIHQSTKRFSGYSTCFRQWRADSHCKYLHGYSLEFVAKFEGQLDDRNWIQDFGGFKEVKKELSKMFDHTLIAAIDDPQFKYFMQLNEQGLIQLRSMNHVGCEMFAKWVYEILAYHCNSLQSWVVSVECFENNNNSAIYKLC